MGANEKIPFRDLFKHVWESQQMGADEKDQIRNLLVVGNLIELVNCAFNKVGFEFMSPLSKGDRLEEISKAVKKNLNSPSSEATN